MSTARSSPSIWRQQYKYTEQLLSLLTGCSPILSSTLKKICMKRWENICRCFNKLWITEVVALNAHKIEHREIHKREKYRTMLYTAEWGCSLNYSKTQLTRYFWSEYLNKVKQTISVARTDGGVRRHSEADALTQTTLGIFPLSCLTYLIVSLPSKCRLVHFSCVHLCHIILCRFLELVMRSMAH